MNCTLLPVAMHDGYLYICQEILCMKFDGSNINTKERACLYQATHEDGIVEVIIPFLLEQSLRLKTNEFKYHRASVLKELFPLSEEGINSATIAHIHALADDAMIIILTS